MVILGLCVCGGGGEGGGFAGVGVGAGCGVELSGVVFMSCVLDEQVEGVFGRV